ncbi:MAG: hypothetical protein LAT76_10515, partial [Schleiferiaceae bacterium]|nr:hypothetical protein [Schleiferiaceae bacterium]
MQQFLLKSTRWIGLLLVLMLPLSDVLGQAQPQVIYDGGATSTNVFPFNSATSNRRAWIFQPSNFPGQPPCIITKLYFLTTATNGPFNFTNLQIDMGNTSFNDWVGNSGSWPTGLTSVINAPSYSVNSFANTSSISGGIWVEFPLQTPFLWDGVSNFIIDARQDGYTPGFSVRQVNVPNTSIFGPAGNPSPSGIQANLAVLGFDWVPAGPCVSPPIAGNTVADPQVVCLGQSTNLSVDSMSFGTGQSMQWQTSLDGITWSNMLNDTNASVSTI